MRRDKDREEKERKKNMRGEGKRLGEKDEEEKRRAWRMEMGRDEGRKTER